MDGFQKDREHIALVISDIDDFKQALLDQGLAGSETVARIDDLLVPLSEFDALLDQQDDVSSTVFRNLGNKITEHLIHTKAQLVSDLSQRSVAPPAQGDASRDVASFDESQDLFDSLIAQTQKGNKANFDHDDVFVSLDNIIKKQTDYTAQLSADALTESFSGLVETHEKIIDGVSGLIEATGDFAHSIFPILEHLREQGETSQRLLESNQDSIEKTQEAVSNVKGKQAETAAQLLRTQRGVDKTRSDMGLSPEFDNSLRVVTDDVAVPSGASSAANNDDYDGPE